jgi:hypothetical protein
VKRLLAVVVVLAICVLAVGFWRGWFSFSVDKGKFQEDKNKTEEKVKGVFSKGKDKAPEPIEKVKGENPKN